MGSSQSKSKKHEYEFPQPQLPKRPYQPPYGQPYPPFMAPYPPMPGYGPQYPPPQQGFLPPGMYGEGARLPPRQLNWMDGDKRPSRRKKKHRRRESERFVGGFAADDAQGREEAPRRAQSESHHRPMPEPVIPGPAPAMAMPEPVIPGAAPAMAMPEPVIPGATGMTRGTSSHPGRRPSPPYPEIPTMPEPVIPGAAGISRQPSGRPPRRPSPPYPEIPTMPEPQIPSDREERLRRRESERPRYATPPPIEGTLADAIRPMSPPNRSAFGPSGERPKTPLRNPLPPPPRDLYEMSPYRSLLTLPQTTALLTANFGTQNGGTGLNRANTIVVHPNGVTMPLAMPAAPGAEVKKSKTLTGGLFRALTKKEKKPEPPPPEAKPIYIPVFVPKPGDGGAQAANGSQNRSTSHLPQPADLSRSMSQNRNHSRRPSMNVTRSGDSTRSSILPVRPMPSHPRVIRFDQDGQYNFFMNHSPHSVLYQNEVYPTALHLHEALKFIGHRDDIARAIRGQDIWDVYPYASQFQEHVRPDWNDTYLDFMEEVLFRKFTQHPDLREKLLGTGDARLVYSDPADSFWGSGLDDRGDNELGKALERVRNKIRADDVGY